MILANVTVWPAGAASGPAAPGPAGLPGWRQHWHPARLRAHFESLPSQAFRVAAFGRVTYTARVYGARFISDVRRARPGQARDSELPVSLGDRDRRVSASDLENHLENIQVAHAYSDSDRRGGCLY